MLLPSSKRLLMVLTYNAAVNHVFHSNIKTVLHSTYHLLENILLITIRAPRKLPYFSQMTVMLISRNQIFTDFHHS